MKPAIVKRRTGLERRRRRIAWPMVAVCLASASVTAGIILLIVSAFQ